MELIRTFKMQLLKIQENFNSAAGALCNMSVHTIRRRDSSELIPREASIFAG
jgi:hypothetical protein